jgi:hypothetical protein
MNRDLNILAGAVPMGTAGLVAVGVARRRVIEPAVARAPASRHW